MPRRYTKGIYLALLAALISGVANFTNKFAVGAITPPLVFTTVKNVGVGLLIVSVLLVGRKWKLVKKLSKKEFLSLVTIGIVGGSIPFYLYFTGLTMVPAINAAIIHKTLVIWVAVLALPFLKEKLTKLQMLAIGLVFLGNLTIGGFGGFKYSYGEVLILVATVFWAVENIIAKKVLSTVDPDIVTSARMGFGSMVLLGASAVMAPAALGKTLQMTSTQTVWMTVAVVTLLGFIMSWYRALENAPATLVATVLTAATLVTNILSAVFVTHTLNSTLFIQFALMVVGISIFIWTLKDVSQDGANLLGA